jgi:hypothetical protein
MINWIKSNKSSIIRVMFIIPIMLVAAISISHVVSWYNLSNPLSWAIYLSIAVEVAAMTALSAASVRVKGFSVWAVFGVVTLIQFIGNIFFSYNEINVNDPNFKNWIELVTPLYDMMGIDSSDPVNHKRWLALISGGLLPLISLTCLHFFIEYGGVDEKIVKSKKEDKTESLEVEEEVKEVIEPVIIKSKIEEPVIIGNKLEEIIKPVIEENKVEEVVEPLIVEEEIETVLEDNEETITPEIIEEEVNEVEFTESSEEKKNPTEPTSTDSGYVSQGTVNNSKIQMGNTRSGENIIYKESGR